MTLFNLSISKTLTGGHIPAWGAKIAKKKSRKPNELSLVIASGNNVTIGDEIKFYDLDNNYKFGGFVQKPNDSTGVQFLQISDYSIVLSQVSVNEVFNAGDTYAEIIEYLIDTYTDFSFVNNLTVTTPTLSKNLVRRDVWVLDVITELLQVFNGNFIVDKNKVFTLSQLQDNLNSSSLINGVDALIGRWQTDNNMKAEKVIVKGALIDQRTTETLTGTGTEFFTARIPKSVEISGLTQTTEDIDGDYTVEATDKKITFDSSETDPVVSYTYESQIRIELGEGKTVTLERKYLDTKSEARKLAREYQAKFIDGAQSSKWLKSTSAIDDFNIGDGIPVTDDINNKTDVYTIQSVLLEYPNKLFITVGEEEEDFFDWQKEAIDRIKQLEQKDNNSDFISVDEFIISNLKIKVTTEFTELKSYIDDGELLWASETTLASDADLISDTGLDEDFALAYDDSAVPSGNIIDYLA